jgi:hypothetical protein
VHEGLGEGGAFRKSEEEPAPEFPARLQHPGFEIEVVGSGYDAMVGLVIKRVEAVQADQFGGAFDQFFGEDKPVGGFSDDDQLIAALLDAFEADDPGAADRFHSIARGRLIGPEADLADEFPVEALDGNSPDNVRGAFGKSRKAGAVGFFADAQTLDDGQGFHGEEERQAREAFLLATGEAPLARFFSEEAAIFGQKRVAVKGMIFFARGELPETGG